MGATDLGYGLLVDQPGGQSKVILYDEEAERTLTVAHTREELDNGEGTPVYHFNPRTRVLTVNREILGALEEKVRTEGIPPEGVTITLSLPGDHERFTRVKRIEYFSTATSMIPFNPAPQSF